MFTKASSRREETYERILKVLPACPEREGHNMHRMHVAGRMDHSTQIKKWRPHIAMPNICQAKLEQIHPNTLAGLPLITRPRRKGTLSIKLTSKLTFAGWNQIISFFCNVTKIQMNDWSSMATTCERNLLESCHFVDKILYIVLFWKIKLISL